MDAAVQTYIDRIAPEQRPLFDRLHGLILRTHPEVDIVISYQIPTYKVDSRRLYVGAWRHGLSMYGWKRDEAAAFIARHPGFKTSTGTIQIRPQDADAIPDDDFIDLIRAALG